MCREGGEAQAGADAAGFVEEAVIEFGAGAEAAVGGVRRCSRAARGCWGAVGKEGGCWRGGEGLGPEVVEAAEAEEGTVGAVEVFGAVFRRVVLEEREDGAAVWEAGVADAGHLQLARRAESTQIERLEGASREEQAAVEQRISPIDSFPTLPDLPQVCLIGPSQRL